MEHDGWSRDYCAVEGVQVWVTLGRTPPLLKLMSEGSQRQFLQDFAESFFWHYLWTLMWLFLWFDSLVIRFLNCEKKCGNCKTLWSCFTQSSVSFAGLLPGFWLILGMQRHCGNIAVTGVFRTKTEIYFSHSKAEQKEVRPRFTTGPCLPTMLCALVAHTDLAVEREWRMPQVVKEKSLWNCRCSSKTLLDYY